MHNDKIETYARKLDLRSAIHAQKRASEVTADLNIEFLTVPFFLIEIVFHGEEVLFESSSYNRRNDISLLRIQSSGLNTTLKSDYEAWGILLDPVMCYEKTGLVAHDLIAFDGIDAMVKELGLSRYRTEKYTLKVGKEVKDTINKRPSKKSCYRVISQFLARTRSARPSEKVPVSSFSDYSSKHLRSTFKDLFGISPRQYMYLLKLQYVLQDMARSKFNMTEIAYRNGFYDQSHLIRVFKKISGIPPGAFAKKYRLYANAFKNTIIR
ncbi:MAG: helix-turn-helix transcriptional regulator [Bacteroidota bacterium]